MYMAKTDGWYIERTVFLIAGVITGLSALLAWQVSPWWLLLTALVSVNLMIFALSGFCIMANILYKLGVKPRLQRGEA